MFLLHTIVLLSCVEEKKHDTHTADTIIDTGEIEDTSPSDTDPENTESEDKYELIYDLRKRREDIMNDVGVLRMPFVQWAGHKYEFSTY